MRKLLPARARLPLGVMLSLALFVTACGGDDGVETESPASVDGEEEEPAEEPVEEPTAEEEPVAEGEEPAEAASGEECVSDSGYPEEPIRVIITFDPGGGSDTDFRRMQPHLEEILGVTLEPDYVTGAGGAIGWAELAHAEPDGYTIGTVVLPHILLQPLMIEDTGYQTEDFDFISMNASAPQILFTDAENPAFETFEEFEAAVEEDPGGIDIGGSAEFNASHMMQVLLEEQGLDTNWVATGEGSTAVVSGVRGGHFPVGITSVQQYVGQEDSVKVLAVFSDETYEPAPDLPLITDLGYDITGNTNWGMAGPAGMDPEHVQTLWCAAEQALALEEVQENMTSEGQVMIGLGPEEATEYVNDRLEDVRSVVPIFQEMSSN